MLDEVGAIVLEQKLGTIPTAMKEVFGPMPRSRIALETGMHSPWVSRALSHHGSYGFHYGLNPRRSNSFCRPGFAGMKF